MKVKIQGIAPVIKATILAGYTNAGVAGTAEISTIDAVADVGGSLGGAYFDISGVARRYRVWFNVDGASTPPLLPTNSIFLTVSISADATDQDVSDAITALLDSQADFGAANGVGTSTTVTITNAAVGVVEAISAGTSGMAVAVSTPGVDAIPAVTSAAGLIHVVGTYQTNEQRWQQASSGNQQLAPWAETKNIDVIVHNTRIYEAWE